jgi:RNA polymerase sigma-70 factor, ECF subfamily
MSPGRPFASILAAARTGAEWAWAEIYADLAPSVLGYLRARGVAEPEDLTGEVFVQVVRSLPDFDGDREAFRAWAFTIAYHRLVDARRHSARRPVEPAPHEVIESRGPSASGPGR